MFKNALEKNFNLMHQMLDKMLIPLVKIQNNHISIQKNFIGNQK